MKRPLFIAVIWGAALLPLAAQAQSRGMGFRGPAAPPRPASGFTGRPAGFAPRPTGFAPRPMPAGRIAPVTVRPVPNGRIISPQSHVFVPGGHVRTNGAVFFSHKHIRFHHVVHNPFFFGHSCFNGFFDPFCQNRFFFGSGLVYPFDPFYSGFYSQPQEPQQPVVVEQDNNSRDLALQVQELTDEVQSLRDEQRMRESRKDAETRPDPRDDGPNATLVFRDGVQLSVRNYAITGDSVWVLDDHKTQKIPISRLDVAATEQVNARNGVEIHLPKIK